MEEAAWRLVWLARDLGDDALAAFAGKLLALLGPLEAHVTAFSLRAPATATAAQPQRGKTAEKAKVRAISNH